MDRVLFKHLSGSRKSECDAFATDQLNEVVIGRDPQADVRFDRNHDSVVGRRHGSVQRSAANPARFVFTDFGSRNGTYLNGARIQGSVDLLPGDVLQFGLGGPKCEFDLEPRPQLVPETAIARQTTTRLVNSEYGWQPPLTIVDAKVVKRRVSPATLAFGGTLLAAAVIAGMLHRLPDSTDPGAVATAAATAGAPGQGSAVLTAPAPPPVQVAKLPAQSAMVPSAQSQTSAPSGGGGAEPKRSKLSAPVTNESRRPVMEPSIRADARPVSPANAPESAAPPPLTPVTAGEPARPIHGGVVNAPSETVRRATPGVDDSPSQAFDKVELIRTQPDRTTKIAVNLRFDASRMIVADPRHAATIKAIPYSSIRDVAYSMSKHARWRGNPTTSAGAVVTLLGGLFKSKQHWLNVRTRDGEEIVLRLHKDNYSEVCDTITRLAHTRVESLVAEN